MSELSRVEGLEFSAGGVVVEPSTLNLQPSTLYSRLLALVGTKPNDPRFQPHDCWGFVRYCYFLDGIDLPKNIWSCRHICTTVWTPRTGEKSFAPTTRLLDVVYLEEFYLEPRHVGVMLDGIYFLQSSRATNGVAMLRLNRVRDYITGIYRLNEADRENLKR